MVAEAISTHSSMQPEQVMEQPELGVGILINSACKDMEVQTRKNIKRFSIQAKPSLKSTRIKVKQKMKSMGR